MDTGQQRSQCQDGLVSPTPPNLPQALSFRVTDYDEIRQTRGKRFSSLFFTRLKGDKRTAPGQEPPQRSSMGLIQSSKRKGKPGCSCHSDTEGEVSALWLPHAYLPSDSNCALVWHTSLAHAMQDFQRLKDRGVVYKSCAVHEEKLSFWRAEHGSGVDPFSQLNVDTGLGLCWTAPATSFSLICLFLLMLSSHTACKILDEDPWYPLKQNMYRGGFKEQKPTHLGGFFSPLILETGSRWIPSLLPENTKTSEIVFVSSCLHLHMYVFDPPKNDLRCAQKWQKCRPIDSENSIPSLCLHYLKSFPLSSF